MHVMWVLRLISAIVFLILYGEEILKVYIVNFPPRTRDGDSARDYFLY